MKKRNGLWSPSEPDQVVVYASDLPDLGWRGALKIPSLAGDIIVRVELPPGALRSFIQDVGVNGDEPSHPFFQTLLPLAYHGAADEAAVSGGFSFAGMNAGQLGQLGGMLLGGPAGAAIGGQLAAGAAGEQAPASPMPGGGVNALLGALSNPQVQSIATGLAGAYLGGGTPPAGSNAVSQTLGGTALMSQALNAAWGMVAPQVATLLRNTLRAFDTEAGRLAGNPDAAAAIAEARARHEQTAARALQMLDMVVGQSGAGA